MPRFIRQKKVKMRFHITQGHDLCESKRLGKIAGSLISDDRNSKCLCKDWLWE
jgi:hypothetical protein